MDPPPCDIDCDPKPEPEDPIIPENPVIPEEAKDPVFNLAYFVPTGSGPYLINRYFNIN